MNINNQKSNSVKVTVSKTDKSSQENPNKKQKPTEQVSQLPKKPAIHTSIHHFTKFIESGFGKFSDEKW